MFYQLFEAIPPYHEERVKSKALGRVMFSRYNRPSNECVELMEWMLKVEPNHRPQSVSRVMEHRWFENERIWSEIISDTCAPLTVFDIFTILFL